MGLGRTVITLHIAAALVLTVTARVPVSFIARPGVANHGAGEDVVSLVQNGWVPPSSTASAMPEMFPQEASRASVVNTKLQAVALEGDIAVLGVATQDNRTTIPMRGVPGWTITNIGAGRKWVGWLGRLEWYATAVGKLVQQGGNKQKMVILIDVADMLFGGCSTAELLNHYNHVVEHSDGALVVYGGTMYCHPHNPSLLEDYKRLLPRMKEVLDAAGMPVKSYCTNQTYLDMWDSPGYSFLNGGFAMGPARELYDVLLGNLHMADKLRLRSDNENSFDDQLAAATYMLQHPDKVTIDYTGRIVLTENKKLLECNQQKASVARKGDHFVNNVTTTTACFIHGANRGINRLRELGFVAPLKG